MNTTETKDRLQELITCLGISPRRIQFDVNWGSVIQGKRGFIRLLGDQWTAVVNGMSRRYSSSVKKKLDFMSVGSLIEVVKDDSKVRTIEFKLDRMPTESEAEMVRKVLGLATKRTLTEDAKTALRERFLKVRNRNKVGKERGADNAIS